ncbi:MazG-like family protein [Kitasatospora herbaricolor]|uniref:MazG-like family protein n=1 Tax=Kitasatospora herbaricolor TaxID=68217 RepID=A0ABZ1WHJ4_9ACTN|nr:MazG-like family protein [Kitasatospora herbaricolor]
MEDTWDIINSLAARLDSRSTRRGEERWLVQIVKLQEEVGEVAEAAIGALGENPRKGFSHSWDDVRAEACDVITTGMVLLARMGGDPRRLFEEHLRRLAARDLRPERG